VTQERIDRFVARRSTTILVAACFLAALRVLVFAAAHPFFANTDEVSHYDLVRKCASGRVPPLVGTRYDTPTLEAVIRFASPEYLRLLDDSAPRALSRLASLPQADVDRVVAAMRPMYEYNPEATSPPLYYALAGSWARAGDALGLRGIAALYWIRMMNVPIVVGMVVLAHRHVRRFYPGRADLQAGAPLLVAAIPQDVFFTMNNDVLSPLACGVALHALLVLDAEPAAHGPARWAAAGLAVAAALLTKLTNWVLVPVALGLLVLRAGAARRAGVPAVAGRALAALLAAAAVPVAVWVGLNLAVLGDPLATVGKVRHLGWTAKPLGALLDHPIFGPRGLWTFLSETTARFWRGEMVWFLDPIRAGWLDALYAVSTVVFVGCAAAAALAASGRAVPSAGADGTSERRTTLVHAAVCAASIASLAWLSIAFDFHDCYYPSRAHPYLTSGRLVLGALIPFAVLWVLGVGAVFRRRTRVHPLVVVAIVCAAVTVAEAALSRGVFRSPYNWFHFR
jgi:hypothetical protein